MANLVNKKTLLISLLCGILFLGLWQNEFLQKFLPVLSNLVNTSRNQNNLEGNDLFETTTREDQPGFISEGKNSFIESLRKREFRGGEIKIEQTPSQNDSFTSYQISYPSDNLKIYGMMNVPEGDPPAGGFPVVILNHGYFNAASFTSGDGTHAMADILAANGYITLASDYRGFGKSEDALSQRSGGHRPEYAIDVLNLIASVRSLPKADTDKIGMWGHSMGGEVSLRTVEATDQIKAVVLWAPTSGNAADNAAFYGGRRISPRPNNPDVAGISPINYLQYISSPISLHQGLSDTEVKPEWSKKLKDALEKEGKTVEFFEYEGQDHNFRNLGWDLISQRTLKFYNKYLKE